MNIELLDSHVGQAIALVVVFTPIAFAIDKATKAWVRHALTTPETWDDVWSARLTKACAFIATAVSLLPRISTGLKQAKEIRDQVAAIERPRP